MSNDKLADAAKALLAACDKSVYMNDYCGLEVSKHDAAAVNAAIEALREALEAAPAPDRVPMPQNADQAAAMVSLGVAWLEQHAPDRLATPAAPAPGWKVTEAQHVAACKVLVRANGLDGLPQRMVNAMLAAAPAEPVALVPLTRKQIDKIMTKHYPLDSLLRENVDAFEACVRDIEAAIAASKGEQA